MFTHMAFIAKIVKMCYVYFSPDNVKRNVQAGGGGKETITAGEVGNKEKEYTRGRYRIDPTGLVTIDLFMLIVSETFL